MSFSCKKCGKVMNDIDDECSCITAEWHVELWMKCPKCGDYFDYFTTEECKEGGYEKFDQTDLWCQNTFDETIAIHVDCPKCESPFVVDKFQLG